MSNELQRLTNSVINAESIANSDRDAIVKILTALAQATKDEPERCETQIEGSLGQCEPVVSAEYADFHRNENLRKTLEIERLRKDAAIGEIVWRFIDRMNDIDPTCDPADKILNEFVKAVMPAIDAALSRSPRSAPAEPLVPRGHFWRGEIDRFICQNCGKHYDKHIFSNEDTRCPVT